MITIAAIGSVAIFSIGALTLVLLERRRERVRQQNQSRGHDHPLGGAAS